MCTVVMLCSWPQILVYPEKVIRWPAVLQKVSSLDAILRKTIKDIKLWAACEIFSLIAGDYVFLSLV